jgi:hypothetical protein
MDRRGDETTQRKHRVAVLVNAALVNPDIPDDPALVGYALPLKAGI